MENFWSLLKRGINGTYVSVEPYHLFRYTEKTFRTTASRRTIVDGPSTGSEFASISLHNAIILQIAAIGVEKHGWKSGKGVDGWLTKVLWIG